MQMIAVYSCNHLHEQDGEASVGEALNSCRR